ncbi:unnamed protein product [Euphydryas editha]|uniref:Glycoside hydrolase family 38 central domain-containing protein n=1 Tax=Euphydryas editha TaxID=104508 RepID=A0AAU9TC21_EUPED|nr:unnamed protein product [Euphydryas editha]
MARRATWTAYPVRRSASLAVEHCVHEKETGPVLETKQDDFFPLAYDKHSYTSGMFTSRPTFKHFVREANVFQQTARQLQVVANLGNNDDLFEEFSWIMGVAQDHNVISGAMRPYVKDYYTEKLHLAVQGASVVITEAINKVRGSPTTTEYRLCYFNISSCPNTEVERFYIIIYNSLAWPVTMPVRLPILNKKYDVFDPLGHKIKAVMIKIPDHVMKIPKRRSKVEDELIFIAENIPALGFRSYFVEETNINRKKKSLIKKINKNSQKKYFIRQASKDNLTYFNDNENYDDYDYSKTETKVEFGDIGDVKVTNDNNNVITPKPTRSAQTTKSYDLTKPNENIQEVKNANDFGNDKMADNDAMKYDLEKDSYYSEESSDNFIKNKYIQINIDEYRKISSLNLSNGVNISLDIQFFYYVSDEPAKLNSSKRNPGAYIFRSIDSHPEPIIDDFETTIFKSNVVEEIHCKYSKYASLTLKLYANNPIVEVDWLVGPVSINDDLGKEVFIRYTTDLENKGVFYTDANGRQTVKRIRDRRALYEPYNLDHIAGNYYPVTSRIYIEDMKRNIRVSVFNDRSQGGTSLLDGSIDLMLHRRILTDDSGVQTFLNETENDVGIIVRGTHYLYITKSNYKQNRLFEKKFAKEIELKPQILISKLNRNTDKKKWIILKNEFSSLKTKLPFGVHILTLQKWQTNKLLLRLENYLEQVDVINDGIKKVFLKDLLKNIKLKNVTETVLSANINLKDWTPLQWQINGSFVKNFNDFYGNHKEEFSTDTLGPVRDFNINEAVVLVPQQIRTFIVDFEYEN